ncbi:MAG: cell cycle transcriptional regulator TrcR, partial [Micropepsaceae bacterium]
MSDKPLMPKATAVWLVDNTSITFDQIADFVGMHPLEVKGIADEDVAKGIKGIDPISNGQLTRELINEAEKNPESRLTLAPSKYKFPQVKAKKTPRYTPVSKRQDKPDAIYWLIRNHPEMTDADIIKLIGTTKATISKIRDRGHWNSQNIKAVDPVTLGLSSQIELDFVVNRAANRKPRQPRKKAETLKPIEDAAAPASAEGEAPASAEADASAEPEAPPSSEPEAPTSVEPETPESAEADASTEPEAPVSAEAEAPPTSEPEAPVSAEAEAPPTSEPEAPASAEGEAPPTSEPEAPTDGESEIAASAEPQAVSDDAPEPTSSDDARNQRTSRTANTPATTQKTAAETTISRRFSINSR